MDDFHLSEITPSRPHALVESGTSFENIVATERPLRLRVAYELALECPSECYSVEEQQSEAVKVEVVHGLYR